MNFANNVDWVVGTINGLFNVGVQSIKPPCPGEVVCLMNFNGLIYCSPSWYDYEDVLVSLYQDSCANLITTVVSPAMTNINYMDFICGDDADFIAQPYIDGADAFLIIYYAAVLTIVPGLIMVFWEWIECFMALCSVDNSETSIGAELKLHFTSLAFYSLTTVPYFAGFFVLWLNGATTSMSATTAAVSSAFTLLTFYCLCCSCCYFCSFLWCMDIRKKGPESNFNYTTKKVMQLVADYSGLLVLSADICIIITVTYMCVFSWFFAIKAVISLLQFLYCTKLHLVFAVCFKASYNKIN
jgi:hypothetical protein